MPPPEPALAAATYHPEDRRYLLAFEPTVQHDEVTDSDAKKPTRKE
jgi:hypothetical protein